MARSSSGNGNTQRNIGKLEGKMDMLIGMVDDLGKKLDTHIQTESQREYNQNIAIEGLDKRLIKIETKWALLTAGLVAGITALWNFFVWIGKEVFQKLNLG